MVEFSAALNLKLQYSTKHEKVRRILKIFQKSLLYQPLLGTEPLIFEKAEIAAVSSVTVFFIHESGKSDRSGLPDLRTY